MTSVAHERNDKPVAVFTKQTAALSRYPSKMSSDLYQLDEWSFGVRPGKELLHLLHTSYSAVNNNLKSLTFIMYLLTYRYLL